MTSPSTAASATSGRVSSVRELITGEDEDTSGSGVWIQNVMSALTTSANPWAKASTTPWKALPATALVAPPIKLATSQRGLLTPGIQTVSYTHLTLPTNREV